MIETDYSFQPIGLASILLQADLLSSDEIQQACANAFKQKQSLISYLVKNNLLSSQHIMQSCAQQLQLACYDLTDYQFYASPSFRLEWIEQYRLLPLTATDSTLFIGMSDPTNYPIINLLRFYTGLHIHVYIVDEAKLEQLIQQYSQSNRLHVELESALTKLQPTAETPIFQPTEQAEEPVKEYVDKLLADAIEKNISDIHIEAFNNENRIRYRQDGLLYEAMKIPAYFANRILTRLKILANLDIAERRFPQDGRLQVQNPKIDLRISTCPTLHGEKIVLRILDSRKQVMLLSELGFTDEQLTLLTTQLNKPQGLILVTGPTGSGKTVTLYAMLQYLNQLERNISTVEDPIEIELPGINQVAIHNKIGLNFPTILRALLRQDPDIIMIGEIRDAETATIAIQAALTGHLVLATLHTNNAIETINRLRAMGIPDYNLIHTLSLIIAQRLVRKLCIQCRQPNFYQEQPVYQAAGCKQCQHGYVGRNGVYEMMKMNILLVDRVLQRASTENIEMLSKQYSGTFLWEMGLKKMLAGITSFAELNRVIGNPA